MIKCLANRSGSIYVGKGRKQERKLHSDPAVLPGILVGINSDLQVGQALNNFTSGAKQDKTLIKLSEKSIE